MKSGDILKLLGSVIAAALVLTGIVSAARQEELAKSVLRLHIVASSDDEDDQELKLMVRDAILERYGDMFAEADNSRVGEGYITRKLGEIEQLANRTLSEAGSGDTARASLTEAYFPTREYDSFTLPPGRYRALRVEIGEGEGQNWWCVLFPPLCMGAAEAAESSGLSPGAVATITSDSETIQLKFLSVELYYRACELFE